MLYSIYTNDEIEHPDGNYAFASAKKTVNASQNYHRRPPVAEHATI